MTSTFSALVNIGIVLGAGLTLGPSSRASAMVDSENVVDEWSETDSLECVVVSVHDDGILAVRALHDGAISLISVTPDIPLLRPALPNDLEIPFSELAVGQILKIAHRSDTREIGEIKVFEARTCDPSGSGSRQIGVEPDGVDGKVRSRPGLFPSVSGPTQTLPLFASPLTPGHPAGS